MGAALVICVGGFGILFVGFSILPVPGAITNLWLAAFNRVLVGIWAPSRQLIPGVSSIGLERLGLIMSVGEIFVLAIALLVTWGSTQIHASVSRKYVLFPSSAVTTILAMGSIALTYFIAIVPGSPGHLVSPEQFQLAHGSFWLPGMYLLIAF